MLCSPRQTRPRSRWSDIAGRVCSGSWHCWHAFPAAAACSGSCSSGQGYSRSIVAGTSSWQMGHVSAARTEPQSARSHSIARKRMSLCLPVRRTAADFHRGISFCFVCVFDSVLSCQVRVRASSVSRWCWLYWRQAVSVRSLLVSYFVFIDCCNRPVSLLQSVIGMKFVSLVAVCLIIGQPAYTQ